MTKMAESLGAVYIYIYIVRFNKITLCEHRRKLCFLDICKKSNEHSFLCACKIKILRKRRGELKL